MTPAKPLSEMIGVHFVTKTKAITTRYGQGNVLVMSDGSECFANASINKWLEDGNAAPFHLEVGLQQTFRPKGSIKDVSFYPVEMWQ
jgi:hypothetical protein